MKYEDVSSIKSSRQGGILFSEISVFCVPTWDCVHTGDRMIKFFPMEVLIRRGI